MFEVNKYFIIWHYFEKSTDTVQADMFYFVYPPDMRARSSLATTSNARGIVGDPNHSNTKQNAWIICNRIIIIINKIIITSS